MTVVCKLCPDPEITHRHRPAPQPAVFLDRDGVLTRALIRDGKPLAPLSLAEFQLLDDAAQICLRLKQAGYRLLVVTNQPEVARGNLSRDTVESMHSLLRARLPIDDVDTCFHDDADRCDCRKPAPGLLINAAARWNIALNRSFMIGDRWRDIEAGRRAGCRTVFIDYAYHEVRPPAPDFCAASLSGAADWILSTSNTQR